MSDYFVAILALASLGCFGLVFIVASFAVKIQARRKIEKCTMQTKGTVIKHKFPGDDRMLPVVEFCVEGKHYRTEKKWNSYRQIKVPLPIQTDVWEDEKGNLCVKSGIYGGIWAFAESMWPIGSTMTVYYFPGNPKINYVDRPINNSFISTVFLISGVALVAIGVIMFFIIK